MKTWNEIKNSRHATAAASTLPPYTPPSIASQKVFDKADDSYNLDILFAEYIWPKLVCHRANSPGFPGDTTQEKWHAILDKMIYSFGPGADDLWSGRRAVSYSRVKEGLYLFAEWFFGLWN